MKLFWQNTNAIQDGIETVLLCDPAAKLAHIEHRKGNYYFKCLGLYFQLNVGNLTEAKRCAEVKFRSVLKDIEIELHRDIPDENVATPGSPRIG